MEWTVRFFMYMARVWQSRRDLHSSSHDKCAYAEERIAMWNKMGQSAEVAFYAANQSYVRIWKAVPHLVQSVAET